MKFNATFRSALLLALLAQILGTAGCGQQNSERQSVLKQDDADTQAKFDDLAPADGLYTGPLYLKSTDQVFTVNLDIKRVTEPEHSQDSQDPSDTISVPKLSGAMTFPALDNISQEDRASFGALMDPMGHYTTATFDYGDFDPSTTQLTLPYSVSGSTGTYGEMSGTLVINPNTGLYHFSGSWFSKPFGTVATFELDVTPRGANQ
jgi:hypothetical protein